MIDKRGVIMEQSKIPETLFLLPEEYQKKPYWPMINDPKYKIKPWFRIKNIIFCKIQMLSPRNLWYAAKHMALYWHVIWNTNHWDARYLFPIIQRYIYLLRTENQHEYGFNAKETRDMQVCEELCKRLFEEKYIICPRAEELRKNGCKGSWRYSENLMKNETELLFKILSKHCHSWWV